jgi:hypothetical protein
MTATKLRRFLGALLYRPSLSLLCLGLAFAYGAAYARSVREVYDRHLQKARL